MASSSTTADVPHSISVSSSRRLNLSNHRLFFDRRYGWLGVKLVSEYDNDANGGLILDFGFVRFDEWKNPSQEALAVGRGMFCILPPAQGLFKRASDSECQFATLCQCHQSRLESFDFNPLEPLKSLEKELEQDVDLGKLEETVTSTKHIALAINEELGLHTKLLDDLDDRVDETNTRLQMVQRKLTFLNKRTKGGCFCSMLLVIAIVIMVLVIWALIKYL